MTSKIFYSSVLSGLILFAAADARAADWVISRSALSGSCHVQPETSKPYIGDPLAGKYPSQKAACEKAKSLNTDDAGDASKCFDYTAGTKDGCKKIGVPLP